VLVATTVARQQIALTEVSAPKRRPGHAVIDVDNVTLCGTDVHIWEDDYASELPLVQGHEIAGRVAGLHPRDQDGTWQVGQPVAVNPMNYCGTCHACRVGRMNACVRMSVLGCHTDGAFQEQMLVPLDKLHPVPEGVSLKIAALCEPISIASQAVARSRASRGDRVLVIGCGPIGLFATLRLQSLGVDVLAVDRVSSRLDTAIRFGASRVQLTLSDDSWPTEGQHREIADWSDGEGPSIVIEATGVPACLEAAVDVVANAGRVVSVGTSVRTASLPMLALAYKELDLLGSRNSLHLIPEALAVISSFPQLTGSLITHRFPLRELTDALRLAASGADGVGKIAIDITANETP